MRLPAPPFAVLFDLDGTLLDTAPDMVAALNLLRMEQGLDPLPHARARNEVSNGSAGLLRLGFPGAGLDRLQELQRRFLDIYAARLSEATVLFPGMAEVLHAIEARQLHWGIVTNKPGWLTEPLLAALGLHQRSACTVSGDTLPERKPHPAPLLHALAALRLTADRAVYVGDAPRDIEAGRAAGMRTILAGYGYLDAGKDLTGWGADRIISEPVELLEVLSAWA